MIVDFKDMVILKKNLNNLKKLDISFQVYYFLANVK